MTFRSGEIYVSQTVHRGLRYAAIKSGDRKPDEIADAVLHQWLLENHADIMQHLQQVEDQISAFKKSIEPKLPIP